MIQIEQQRSAVEPGQPESGSLIMRDVECSVPESQQAHNPMHEQNASEPI